LTRPLVRAFGPIAETPGIAWSLDERHAAAERSVAELVATTPRVEVVAAETTTGPRANDLEPESASGPVEARSAANLGRWLALGLLAGGAHRACVHLGSTGLFRRRIWVVSWASR